MVRCKICDVRDYPTARLCADLGADFIGLHGAYGIKDERREGLLEISKRIPMEFPNLGLVLVTLEDNEEHICSMLSELRPSHIQLHSKTWTRAGIQRLRDRISKLRIGIPKVIGVAVAPSASLVADRISDIGPASEILLVDINDYSSTKRREPIPPFGYLPGLARAHELGLPAFIAGGLNPENIEEYVSIARPWGVDVQRGVEIDVPSDGKTHGKKDSEKLRNFIGTVKRFG